MTEQEIESAYGPVHSRYRVSRMGFVVGAGVAAAMFVAGIAVFWFAWVWLRVPGERPMEQLGLLLVGAMLSLFVAPLVTFHVVRGARHDSLELRALGLVRRSKSFGLKHCRYVDVTRIEHGKRPDGGSRSLDVFMEDGRFIGVYGFEISGDTLESDLARRASQAVRETRQF